MAFERANKGFYIQGSIIDDTENTSHDITGEIEDVMIKKAYIENSFPLYVVDIRTTEEMRDIMRDHEIRLSLRISSYNGFQAETTENEDSIDIPEESIIFNDILRIYEKPFPTTASKKNEENDEDSENTSTSVNFIYYRVSGIPEKLISKNSQIINKAFENVKTGDVLVNIYSEIDPTSEIYIQEPSSKTQFNSILIPPMSLVQATNYLQNFYGIYDKGLNVFLDENKTFLYSPLNIESTNVIEIKVKDINNDTADNTDINYVKIDEDNNIQLTMHNAPAFTTNKKISGDELGSNTIYYSYDENFNLNKRSDSDEDNYTKVRYFWNGIDSSLKETEYTNLSKLNSKIVFRMASINPEIISPLTEVSVDTKVEEIKGQYFINELIYLFNSTDFKHYSSAINVSCIKK